MALKWADKVVEQSTTTTTAAYQLGGVPSGSPAGSQIFVAGIGDTNTCYYEAEQVGGSAYERGIGTVADAATDTLTRTTIHASSNGGAAVDWTGLTVKIRATLPAYAVRRFALDNAHTCDNLTIVTSRSGNAETIALKTLSGTDPSATDPIRIGFANTSGGFDILEVTAATSFVWSSGSTGGALNATAFKMGIVAFNDGGTFRLGAVCRPSALNDQSVQSSTAEGGAGAADTARTIYTGTAVTSKRMRVLGYLDYTLATVGTWDTAPSAITLTRAGAMEVQVDEVLYESTLGGSGAFDTGTLPPGDYTEFRVQLQLRGTASATNDAVRMYFNADTTLSNYRRLMLAWSDSGAPQTYSGDDNYTFECSAATSTSGDFSESEVVITSPTSTSKRKTLRSLNVARRSATVMGGEVVAVNWESTAAITSIQVRTDNHATDLFAAGSYMKLTGRKIVTVLT